MDDMKGHWIVLLSHKVLLVVQVVLASCYIVSSIVQSRLSGLTLVQ